MIDTNCWRAPIPTDILNSPDYDDLDFAVLAIILGRVRREDGPPKTYYHGNKKVTVHLKKGQTLFRVDNFAKCLATDPRKIRKSIEKLKIWYTNLQTEAKPYGLIISVLDYDNLTKMQSNLQSSGRADAEQVQSSGRTKNKTVEIEETEKTVERNTNATAVAISQKKQISEEAIELTQYLWQKIQANNEYAKEPNLEKWAEEMDKILRIDKRDLKAIRFLIEWSQQDSFWSTNILSPAKLRKHFEKLFLNARQEWQKKEKNRIPSFD